MKKPKQESRKRLTSKIFGSKFELTEKVQRQPWTKETIRGALQEVVNQEDLKKNLSEGYRNRFSYSKIKKLHDTLVSNGFDHQSSGEHSGIHGNFYKHPHGHTASVNDKQDYHIHTSTGSHLSGTGHTSLQNHLKYLPTVIKKDKEADFYNKGN